MKQLRISLSAVLICAICAMLFTACSLGGGSLSGITMSQTELSLSVGDSMNLTVSAEPSSASVPALTWTSSDSNIVTVEAGLVKAKAVGQAVVQASTNDGKSCTCNVSVTGKEVTKVMLNQQTAALDANSTIQLTATIDPADATNNTLTWSSSNESVAIVNSDGYVTGVSAGVANIVCKAPNGVEASCTITVKGSSSSSSQSSDSNSSNNSNNSANTGSNAPYGHFNPSYSYRSDDFVFPDSSVRQLTRSEISSKLNSLTGPTVSGSYAQDAINEIYARNGYCFRTASIRDYYEAQPWYYADESFTINDFNSIENYNINLLLDYT